MTLGDTNRRSVRHNGRCHLAGGIDGKNRSKSGVWNICSYKSLCPVDSSSQSGNFLSRLNTTHPLNLFFNCCQVRRRLQRAQGRGKGRRMA